MKVGKLCILLFTGSILLFSCKKGDTGPQGPPGPEGSPNVQYSDWFTPDVYKVTTRFGISSLDYTKAAPAITQEILDKGTVLVYGKLNGYSTSLWTANQTAQLPIQIYYQIGAATNIDTWSALPTVGNLRINLVSSANAYTSDQSISHNHSFRYVIIPGGVKLGLANRSSVSALGYAELCDALKIPQ